MTCITACRAPLAVNHKEQEYRRGLRRLESWHEQCRLARVEKRIAARKEELNRRLIQEEQSKLYDSTAKQSKHQ